ncbi:MAG: hypothetical protein ACRD68_16730, partial [Pyrinomonadaceae bacterium]
AGGRAPQAGPPGPPPAIVIAAGAPAVKFRRYAPDSVKFGDAKSSSFDELKTGDQLRALGSRSEDGARFTPEEIVTGSFRTIVGTITEINAAGGEIKIKTLQGGQPMTVVVSKDSEVKQVPADLAQRMQVVPGGPGGGGQRRMMGGGIQEMLERLPVATLEELKPGTMVVFSTTGADPQRATAIQLVSGIDPIVNMMQARAHAQGRPINLGQFNLGIGQP